jgi:hypothetical protein
MCGFGFFLAGLLLAVFFVWIALRNISSGQVWAGKQGYIARSENRFGFWSAILMNLLYCVAGLAVIWLAAGRVCLASV